jgi:hypothetical protein
MGDAVEYIGLNFCEVAYTRYDKTTFTEWLKCDVLGIN